MLGKKGYIHINIREGRSLLGLGQLGSCSLDILFALLIAVVVLHKFHESVVNARRVW